MIEVTDLTGGELKGAGLYDELMRSLASHLKDQYESGAITGTDYATVYLGGIQAALTHATQFVLGKDLTNQQILLLVAQTENANKQILLTTAQIANIEADTAVKIKQLDLMVAQIAQTQAQVLLTNSQKLKTDKDTEIGTKQLDVMTSQIAQTTEQVKLIKQQVINTTNENTTITKQQAKLDVEVAVLTQKKLTEEAQILDTVNGLPVAGVIGKQKILYHQQARGFDRDAEQKLAKILVDTYTVRQTTAGGEDPAANGVDGPQVKQVLTIAKAGITAPIV